MMCCFFVAPILLTSWALGQTTEQPLSFEVASVKPASASIKTKDDYTEGYNAGLRAALAARGIRVSGQRVEVTDNSLRDLIRLSYEVKDYQISAPGWMAEGKYEIAATMPAGATRSQAPPMMRTLLEQRFHLKLHRETRKMPVYALVEAKGGARLLKSAYRAGNGMASAGRIVGMAQSLSQFADLMTKASGHTVVDATGIAGAFDFDLNFTPDASEEGGPGLESALREKFGLRLEKREIPVEVLVIDQADRVPVAN